MRFDVPLSVQKALDCLNACGFDACLVGGCVRNWLMGIAPHDFDITTNALPEQTMACFDGYKTVETGLKHGTVTVIIDGEPIEITTYRADGEYLDNRRPEKVEFVSDLCKDLARRDFTMNAIAYSYDEIIDPFGGVADIENRCIRCVGDPYKRFDEDGLRIMRALRFSADLGFEIEPQTSDAIHAKHRLLANISAERKFSELSKLLCGAFAPKVLCGYSDVFCLLIPELSPSDVQSAADAFVGLKAQLAVRLARLLLPLEENAETALRRFKPDKATLSLVTKAIEAGARDLTTESGALIAVSELGFDAVLISAELKGERNAVKCIEKARADGRCLSIRQLEISGDDLALLGLKGKEIGNMLTFLLKKVILGETDNSYSELLDQAKIKQKTVH